VILATILINAVKNSIGHDKLSSDVVAWVINGMSKASTDNFCNICKTHSAMLNSSYFKQMMHRVPLYKQLVLFLTDAETKYLELLSAKMWKGVGVNNTHKKLAFKLVDEEYEDYQTFVVKNGCNAIPFDEWAKTVNCHHCCKKGHICPTCSLYLDNVKL
jgi:hypothetical protein